jgi:large subunit ribosomal protein L4
MKLDVKNLDGSAAGSIDLPQEIFGVEVRKDILARMVNYQLAKRRAGTHKSKGRAEVKATSKKMYAQKGTGQARHGNKAAPQFRGGGKAFGPVVRDHAHDLPKKVRKLAMKTALSAKAGEGKLVVLETMELKDAKTSGLAAKLKKLGIGSALIVGGASVNENFARAASNLVGVDVLPQQGANVYDILRRDTLVLTRDAVKHFEERLK